MKREKKRMEKKRRRRMSAAQEEKEGQPNPSRNDLRHQFLEFDFDGLFSSERSRRYSHSRQSLETIRCQHGSSATSRPASRNDARSVPFIATSATILMTHFLKLVRIILILFESLLRSFTSLWYEIQTKVPDQTRIANSYLIQIVGTDMIKETKGNREKTAFHGSSTFRNQKDE